MFCTKCGSKLPDGTLFCSNCGASLGGGVPAAGIPLRPADEIDYKLFGDDMQLVEIELDPGESVLAEAGAMTYIEKDIKMETIFGDGSGQDQGKGLWGTLANAGKRALSGESLFMTVFTNVGTGKSHAAFAAPFPGKIIPVELKEFDGTLICQKNAFLCAAKGVAISISFNKKIGAGFFGGEGFIMQRLSGRGTAFIEIDGYACEYELAAGESMIVDTGYLAAMSDTCSIEVVTVPGIKNMVFGGEGIFNTVVRGPGKITLQTMPISAVAGSLAGFFPGKGD